MIAANPDYLNPSSDPRLRICVIGSTYPRHADDYAVPWLRESVRRIVQRGHDVRILAPSFEGLADHEIDGVPVKRFRYAPQRWERLTHEQGAPNRIRNPLYQALGLPYVVFGRLAAVEMAKREQFDIIHAHWPFPHGYIAAAAARACNAPLVITSHGAEFALARRKAWVRPLLRTALSQADLLIANSSDTASQIKEVSGRSSLVLPFGSTVNAMAREQASHPIPRILFTGRLIQRKGVEYLLRAVPQILEQGPVEVIVTGSGDQRNRLEALSRQLGLDQTVQFLGFVSNERLEHEYSRCDVWVNPSIIDDRGDTEGLGVGAIEAYSHGKPVVTSNVGGIPDCVVHNKTGYLVPEKDPEQLATAILDLIQNPEKARDFGQAGHEFAQRKFNWDNITNRLEDAYYGLLRARGHEQFFQSGSTFNVVQNSDRSLMAGS